LKKLLDLENWPRKEHFEFFNTFDEPFYGATVLIDCTKAYAYAKEQNTTFFILYLYKTLLAVNKLEPLRYRIKDTAVYIHDQIDASATIAREDGSFGFSYIPFHHDYALFEQNALIEIDRVKKTSGLFTRSFAEFENLIHFSAIPWLNFTSLSHARSYSQPDSAPKISFGKLLLDENRKRSMPMSIHVHHGLVDGIHLGQFVDYFQELMNE
jgi:chloramphenicol O-acetyltransferase type A